jgi:hypothetical protein
MTDRDSIRARALIKRVRPMLPEQSRRCFDAALAHGGMADGLGAVEGVPMVDGALRALTVVALFYAKAPPPAFQSALMTAWPTAHEAIQRFAKGEGDCLRAMFRYAKIGIPNGLPEK